MDILFISYADVSLRGGNVRVAAMLRALADAGHRIDLAAPAEGEPPHPDIRLLVGGTERPPGKAALRMACLRAVQRGSYDVIHAVDEAIFFAARLGRWKKTRLVYDATRCFTGKAGLGASSLWRFFPKRLRKLEAWVLGRVDLVFSPCTALIAELRGVDREAEVMQLEDIPAQPLYDRAALEGSDWIEPFGGRPETVVVCSMLPGAMVGLRKVLMAARKVADAEPGAVFFFKGAEAGQGRKMAASLDIADRCVFLPADETESFLSILGEADAILLVPPGTSCYIHPQVYTLLQAGAPLVAVRDPAFDEVLTEQTSVRVLPSTESIAGGLLRALREPLFSRAVAAEGQQLVAGHTFSSFKHQVRMAYRQLSKKE